MKASATLDAVNSIHTTPTSLLSPSGSIFFWAPWIDRYMRGILLRQYATISRVDMEKKTDNFVKG